jgi:hypothetical protein
MPLLTTQSARGYGFGSLVTAGGVTSFESIATQTVGSGGVSSVTLSSIPSTYTHLQVRIFAQTNRSTYGRDGFIMRINSDTGSNYSYHYLVGDGASSGGGGASSQTSIRTPEVTTTTAGSNIFGTFIVDILDYANTSKNKTARMSGGGDHNGTVASLGGQLELSSGAWYSTTAINSISFAPNVGTSISQGSQFALYGIKG